MNNKQLKKHLLLILCFVPIFIPAQTDKNMIIRLKPIKENFGRINSTTKWTKIVHKYICDKSTEGGEINYYYLDDKLEKVIAAYYGEKGKSISEYYILNDTLSFVFEQEYEYNRPIYWNEEVAEENDDSEVFDLNKSHISETRNYFEKGKIIYQLPDDTCNIELKEKKLMGYFEEYLSLLNKENITQAK